MLNKFFGLLKDRPFIWLYLTWLIAVAPQPFMTAFKYDGISECKKRETQNFSQLVTCSINSRTMC